MDEEKRLIIHFNNGSNLEVAFPVQIRDSTAGVLEAFKRIMDADKLAIHAEDRLLIIPWPSVKYVELIPPPLTVPFGTVQKAKIVGRAEDTRS
jgi:hypothetical protein